MKPNLLMGSLEAQSLDCVFYALNHFKKCLRKARQSFLYLKNFTCIYEDDSVINLLGGRR